MRPLNSGKRRRRRRRKNNNQNRQISTERISNSFQNKNFWIELWQILFFSTTSILFIYIFSTQAFRSISFDQTKIEGLSGIKLNAIQKSTTNFYPKNLLELNPKEIESYLMKEFPIKDVSANRKFFPPGINLNIIEREPIAFASRVSGNDIENGMIDIEGYWIPLQFVNKSKGKQIKLFIENWIPNKKNDIILIIKNKFLLQSTLQKITINPNQEIRIKTEDFNSVLLGSDTKNLNEQINKLNQLQKSLPNLLINTKVKVVDLKDPSKTELKIEKILTDQE